MKGGKIHDQEWISYTLETVVTWRCYVKSFSEKFLKIYSKGTTIEYFLNFVTGSFVWVLKTHIMLRDYEWLLLYIYILHCSKIYKPR